jgi:hypothetical protein
MTAMFDRSAPPTAASNASRVSDTSCTFGSGPAPFVLLAVPPPPPPAGTVPGGYGQADIARHLIQRMLNHRFLN